MTKTETSLWTKKCRTTFINYDSKNPHHVAILKQIRNGSKYYEVGNLSIKKYKTTRLKTYYSIDYFAYLKPKYCPGMQGSSSSRVYFEKNSNIPIHIGLYD